MNSTWFRLFVLKSMRPTPPTDTGRRSRRAALSNHRNLEAFCKRLLQENASSSYHAEHEADIIVLRVSTTPINRLTSPSTRQAMDSARMQASCWRAGPVPYLALEAKVDKDGVYQLSKMEGLILVGLSNVQHAERRIEEGLDIDDAIFQAFSLRKRAERILLGKVFFMTNDDLVAALRPNGQRERERLRLNYDLPLDLQAWLFSVGLHYEAMKLTSVTKATIYKYHLGLEAPPRPRGLPDSFEK
ncbi:hypothetical protein LAZ67_5003426 [Cordylochernes scorpioides]|uniref:Uncharacterized protein n=1 Tax=Cordylochernes scorpioides TaxID=51811 RepID=A0ABY6KJ39_9ARAC|nr:hypothetical protein LAZ67_5003426 [Cordylochernes scorpioides]